MASKPPPLVRVLAVAYPCLTAFAVLATGNHFLLDIAAGLAALAISVLLVGSRASLTRRLAPLRHVALRGCAEGSVAAAHAGRAGVA